MKKTSKALMGVTALVIAFSACALTACNGEPKDGSIKGNYTEATTEEVATTLSAIDEDKLFGDSTVAGYKFGLDVSSDISFITDVESVSTSTVKIGAGYKMQLSGTEDNPSFKGAGNLTFTTINELKVNISGLPKKTEDKVSLEAYQNNAMLYATLNMGKQAGATEDTVQKLKLDLKKLADEFLPDIPTDDTTVPDAPSDTPTTDTSSDDLSASLAELTAQGATVAMDTADGVKLKVSMTKEMVVDTITKQYGDMATVMLQAVTFNKCTMDMYLSIDKAGLFSAASMVMDIDYTVDASKLEDLTPATLAPTSSYNVTSYKLNGFVKIKASPDVNPVIPAGIETDTDYIDGTQGILQLIGGLIGGNDPVM